SGRKDKTPDARDPERASADALALREACRQSRATRPCRTGQKPHETTRQKEKERLLELHGVEVPFRQEESVDAQSAHARCDASQATPNEPPRPRPLLFPATLA